jgi:hypothetical protein
MYRGNAYTIKKAAEILGITAVEVLELIELGELDAIRKPNCNSPSGEVRMIPDYEIEHYLESVGRPCDDVKATVRPMQVNFEVTMEVDDNYDETAAAFMRNVFSRYNQNKIDDLY